MFLQNKSDLMRAEESWKERPYETIAPSEQTVSMTNAWHIIMWMNAAVIMYLTAELDAVWYVLNSQQFVKLTGELS